METQPAHSRAYTTLGLRFAGEELVGEEGWDYLASERICKRKIGCLSKLFRNVPIINYLEMSPFQLLCSRWKCALERSPVVRAKRKCAFQRAAVRLPGWGPVAACSGIPVATGDLSWLCESRWDAVLTDAAQGTSVPVP